MIIFTLTMVEFLMIDFGLEVETVSLGTTFILSYIRVAWSLSEKSLMKGINILKLSRPAFLKNS